VTQGRESLSNINISAMAMSSLRFAKARFNYTATDERIISSDGGGDGGRSTGTGS
jgi:hypothetical protein